jgi:hypothetical protein
MLERPEYLLYDIGVKANLAKGMSGLKLFEPGIMICLSPPSRILHQVAVKIKVFQC